MKETIPSNDERYQFCLVKGAEWQIDELLGTPIKPIKIPLLQAEFEKYLDTLYPDVVFAHGSNPHQNPLARFLAAKTSWGAWSVDLTGYFFDGNEFQGKGNAVNGSTERDKSGLPDWAWDLCLNFIKLGRVTPKEIRAFL